LAFFEGILFEPPGLRGTKTDMRISGTTFTFALGVVISFAAATATKAGAITDLGTLGGSFSFANGINDAGQVVGFSSTAGDATVGAFLYSGGVMTNLGTFGGLDTQANGINASGQVVGYSYTAGNATIDAFLYSGGVLTDLGTLGGSLTEANAINNAGQVVGEAALTGNLSADAFLYSGGVMTDLGSLGSNSSATGINASGQVVIDTSSGGFLYSGGVMTSLGTFQPTGINDAGQIVGAAATAVDPDGDAFLDSGGVMTDLGTLGGDSSLAYAIDASGEVVGTSATPTNAAGDAFLYTTSSGMIDLNSLLPAGSGWVLQVATGINDSGQVVGLGLNPEGQEDAFLLDTTPEPASMALFGAGAALLVMMRKKLRRPLA
jgi:probable HAF family extracellular repeat protein